MKNILLLFTTLILGLLYGYCLAHFPIVSQMIASTVGFSLLFLFAVALYEVNPKNHERRTN